MKEAHTEFELKNAAEPVFHASLFSGIGGFDLAAQWMGWENVFQVEIDEWCRKVLAKNFPDTKRYEDIKNFNANEYKGRVDVISGGFPCQPFSVAGQRKGKDDDRHLWPEMLRIISEVQPSFVVGENVTGIIGMALDTVLFDLEAQGYTTETFIIPACGKNAWHKRDRVWIVAYSNSIRRQNEQKENEQLLCNGKRNGAIEEQSGRKLECVISEPSIISNTESIGGEQSRITRKRRTGLENSSSNDGGIISDTNNTGCEEQRKSITNGEKFSAPKCSSWWEVEPGVGRVVNGLSNRVDRLRGLGNAIVPQVAFEIFLCIKAGAFFSEQTTNATEQTKKVNDIKERNCLF